MASDRLLDAAVEKELATTPDTSKIDAAVEAIDFPYFLYSLKRFLKKELVSDDIAGALLFNIDLMEKHHLKLATLRSAK
jgi:hypothetical protein